MIRSRWWLVALAAMSAGSIGVLVAEGGNASAIAIGVAIVVVYAALFLALRKRAEDGNPPAIVLAVATALAVGGLTALNPTLAFAQFFAYPVIWVVAGRMRWAVLASAGVAIAVALGFWVSLRGHPDAALQIAATQVLSFVFSIVMGTWISRIVEWGQERGRLLDELTAAQDALAAVHRDSGVTEERARLSREMHDTVAQSLTGLVLLAQRARRERAAGTLDDATLELIETSARDALAETRTIVAAGAPVALTDGGLAEALAALAERFERETGIPVAVEAELAAPLERDAEVVLLRCAQEGLANVRKHAEASSARIVLASDENVARVSVVDDGRGFAGDPGGGFGLAGLRDRLAIAGGELAVDGTPGATTLTATLPRGGVA